MLVSDAEILKQRWAAVQVAEAGGRDIAASKPKGLNKKYAAICNNSLLGNAYFI